MILHNWLLYYIPYLSQRPWSPISGLQYPAADLAKLQMSVLQMSFKSLLKILFLLKKGKAKEAIKSLSNNLI